MRIICDFLVHVSCVVLLPFLVLIVHTPLYKAYFTECCVCIRLMYIYGGISSNLHDYVWCVVCGVWCVAASSYGGAVDNSFEVVKCGDVVTSRLDVLIMNLT